MTGRTHDLAAFTALTYVVATMPTPDMSLGTIIVAFSANMIGGLAPDLDQPTAALWNRIPAGSVFGRILHPLFGGHRFISHSIIGIAIAGFIVKVFLTAASHTLIVDETAVWWAFMIGFISHLVMDTFTRDGVPWLFPIPIKFGIPPLRILRMKTKGFMENMVVFPGLLILNGYLYYTYYDKFLEIFKKTN